MKKLFSLLLPALLLIALLSACRGAASVASNEQEAIISPEAAKAADQYYDEDMPPLEPVDDTAILVVSFGTSYLESLDLTIGAVEKAIRDAFPQYSVRRAFTSQLIIDKLAERDNMEVSNVTQALDRAVADGIRKLIVQPTHLMNGLEYTDLKNELDSYADAFDQIVLGEPLLSSDRDFEMVMQTITADTASYDDGQTAIVFMGHGTEADSNSIYSKLQETLTSAGFTNYYVGTVEAAPSLDDIVSALRGGSYTRVVLEPLMVVAGDHANNDMAGDEADSWKSVLTQEGYQVECILEGLGQKPAIQDLYIYHVEDSVMQLN